MQDFSLEKRKHLSNSIFSYIFINLLEQVPLHHRNDLCVLYIYCSLLHTVLPAAVVPNGAVAVGGFVLAPKVKKDLTVKHKKMCVYCWPCYVAQVAMEKHCSMCSARKGYHKDYVFPPSGRWLSSLLFTGESLVQTSAIF